MIKSLPTSSFIKELLVETGIKLPEKLNEIWQGFKQALYDEITSYEGEAFWEESGDLFVDIPNPRDPSSNIQIEIISQKRYRGSSHSLVSNAAYGKITLVIKDDKVIETLALGLDKNHSILDPYKNIFVHELIHAMDLSTSQGLMSKYVNVPSELRKKMNAKTATLAELLQAFKIHGSNEIEWRAYAGEIMHDVYVKGAYKKWLMYSFMPTPDGSDNFSHFLNTFSDKWRSVKLYLPEEGIRYVLKAVYVYVMGLLEKEGFYD